MKILVVVLSTIISFQSLAFESTTAPTVVSMLFSATEQRDREFEADDPVPKEIEAVREDALDFLSGEQKSESLHLIMGELRKSEDFRGLNDEEISSLIVARSSVFLGK